MKNVEDIIIDTKKAIPNVTPTPPDLKSSASAQDLKARLEWGEPALTIIDVRDRDAFLQNRITGAMSMPVQELVETASSSLEPVRDIYIYGATEQDTAQAASDLRSAGFENVAEIRGGLEAWKSVAGPTEGIVEEVELDASAFNVFSRVSQHLKTQKAAEHS